MTDIEWRNEEEYVWYAGYGSNLCQERFMCYIRGGKFKWGGSRTEGCTDRTPPRGNELIAIPRGLYFAGKSRNWQNGGVAFLKATQGARETGNAYVRIWKITANQFDEVCGQEGGFYTRRLDLGQHDDGLRIVTVTCEGERPVTSPSDAYLKTMALGLKETRSLNDREVLDYLLGAPGVRGCLAEAYVAAIVDSAE